MPRYLTLDQGAELLGWVGSKRSERLLRVIVSKERRLGREIVPRLGGSRNGVRYGLTEQILRRNFAEMFMSTPDELIQRLGPALGRLDERIEVIVDERLAPQIEELRCADQLIARSVECVERRVARLESPRESPTVPHREPVK
jgi:hypothetical protein